MVKDRERLRDSAVEYRVSIRWELGFECRINGATHGWKIDHPALQPACFRK